MAQPKNNAPLTFLQKNQGPGFGSFTDLKKPAPKPNLPTRPGGDAASTILHFLGGAVHGTIGAGLPIGGEIYNRVVAPIAHLPKQTIHPSDFGGKIGTTLFGNEDILTPTQTYTASKQAGHGAPFSFLAAGLTVAGAYPGGNIEKKVIDDLVKAGTAADATKALIKSGVDENIAKKIAPAVAQTKDPNIIKNIIDRAHSPSPPISRPVGPPTPDEILNREVGQGTPAGEVIPVPKANPMQDILDTLSGKPAAPDQSPVKGLESVRREQNASISAQRSERFRVSAAGAAEPGSTGYFKELSALKGEYDKPRLGGLLDNIGPQRAEDLFTNVRQQIHEIPDEAFSDYIKQNGKAGLHPAGARLNLQTAVRKVIFGEGGGVPTTSEIKLIRHVNGPLADQIEAGIPKQRKIMDFAARLAGLPRALQATFDLSMGGRQGILVAARHPVIWAKANKESFKMFKDADYYHQEMQSLRNRPSFDLGEKYGLRLPAAHGEHEEAFASADLAESIPGVKHAVLASSRAYDGGLSQMRMDLWDHLLSQYGGIDAAESRLGSQGMKDIAEVVNTMTGRGGKPGGLVESHMKSLSTTLFSPRLWASRLNTLNPAYYHRLTPAAKKEALQAAGSFAAVTGAVLTALAAAGAEVNTDPRSADFLKPKFGDTRYDILGGFQQNIVWAYRELSGEKVNSQTGNVTKFARSVPEILTGKHPELDTGPSVPDRVSVATDVVGNKLNPALSTGIKLAQGKDKSGQDINPLTEIGKLFIPLNVQGAFESIRHTGGQGLAKGAIGFTKNIPNTFGVSVQSYGEQDLAVTDKQKTYLNNLKAQGADKQEIAANKSFFQLIKGAPSRTTAYKNIHKALDGGDYQTAQQLAQEYNDSLDEHISSSGWVDKNEQYLTPELEKLYASTQIHLTSQSIKQYLKSKEGL